MQLLLPRPIRKEVKPVETKETIFQTYVRQVCSICKNKDQCQEELRIKTDNSIKCDKFETTFEKRKIDPIMYSTRW